MKREEGQQHIRTLHILTHGKEREARVRSVRDTNRIAQKYAKELRGGDVLALSGSIGSGKTTFTQCLARALGVPAKITSPTFVLMRVYPLPKPIHGIRQLCHIDTYRLRTTDELVAIGVQEYIGDPTTLTVIEWAEKVKRLLPKNTTWISFIFNDTV